MTGADRIPVVLAVGQSSERDAVVTPVELMERAARAALDEAPGLDARIDAVSVVNILFGGGQRPAGALADRLGLADPAIETTTVGGNTPQWLVTRAAAAIAAGERTAWLIAGAEAARSAKAAGATWADRPEDAAPADPVVGDDRPGMSVAELAVGLFLPAHVYPLFESVLAARAGRSFADQRRFIGALMAPFTEVAAGHDHAWFRDPAPALELAEPTPDNRLVAEPYTKRMNAFLGVDQAAAIVVTSLDVAVALGAEDRAVFVWAGADANDAWFVSSRPDLGISTGVAAAGRALFDAAGVGVDDVGRFDLYSCFPSAVEMGAAALDLRLDDARGLTVTGGLPYFGGPGNNYPAHAIATMVDIVRGNGGLGLTTGLGWFVTKHSIGLYGAQPPPHGFRVGATSPAQEEIDGAALEVAPDGSGPAEVEAATVLYGKDGEVAGAPVIASLDDGRRVVARAHKDHHDDLAGVSLVGAAVRVEDTPPTYRIEETT